MGKEVRGLRSTDKYFQNSHGAIKYSIGNGVAKESTRGPWTRIMVWGLPE